MDIDFKKLYIDYTFETINSSDFLTYKNRYIDDTLHNYEIFKVIVKELSDLEKNNGYQLTDTTKHTFKYNDIEKIDLLKTRLKIICKSQKTLFNNFKHYISTIVEEPVIPTTAKKSSIYNFLKKVVIK